MSVYDYINDKNEIVKFKKLVGGLQNNIRYHNIQIIKDQETIKIYNEIINELGNT